MKAILTINDVAEKLQMSTSTIYKYAEQGKIPSFKIGACRRFFEEEINNYVLALSKAEGTKASPRNNDDTQFLNYAIIDA
jgi:PTS system nitrogen regulatory IIA component